MVLVGADGPRSHSLWVGNKILSAFTGGMWPHIVRFRGQDRFTCTHSQWEEMGGPHN